MGKEDRPGNGKEGPFNGKDCRKDRWVIKKLGTSKGGGGGKTNSMESPVIVRGPPPGRVQSARGKTPQGEVFIGGKSPQPGTSLSRTISAKKEFPTLGCEWKSLGLQKRKVEKLARTQTPAATLLASEFPPDRGCHDEGEVVP